MWIGIFLFTSIDTYSVPYPTGICAFFNCSIIVSQYTFFLFITFGVILAILYILEKWMLITTFLMFLISLIFFTLEESNGILNRNGLYTMIFLAQFVAYYRNNLELKNERIQFSVQIIAAGYTLAGISKLKLSGLNWVADAPLVSIQVIKNYYYHYFDIGDINYAARGIALADFIIQHPLLIKILFSSSLLLELFALLAIKNKIRALVYGFLLTMMHLGIYYFMNIIIVSIFAPMFIILINPLGLFYSIGYIFFQSAKAKYFTK